ncbi:MAG: DUF2059 domain-containing protein [Chitinophagaceae bacterium]
MKKILKIVLLFTLAFLLFLKVDAQTTKAKTKTTTQTKKEEVEPPPPPAPPPPGMEMREATPDEIEAQKKADEELMNPKIDFDTTAAPDDIFTKNVMRLLEVTQAITMGTNIAQNMPQSDQSEMMKEFYARFIKDMQEGTARRWLERIYVRAYRARFTNEEIEGLIKFYDTPLGKKVVKENIEMLPGVMSEGKKLGSYIGIKIYSQLLEEQKKN